MDPSNIPINSISIDIPACAAEDEKNDGVDCNHDFTIRGYVLANRKKRGLVKHWPFNEESRNLFEEHGYNLPPLSLPPRCRWHACKTCLREIKAKDFEIQQNVIVMPVIFGQKLDEEPPVIPSTSAVINNEEKAATAAGDDLGEEIKEDVEREGSQKGDQQKGAKRAHSVGPVRRYNFRNNRRKVESQVNKKSHGRMSKSSTGKEKAVVDQAVNTALDLVPQVEDTPCKDIRSDGLTVLELDSMSSENGRNKTRSLNELLKKDAAAAKKQSCRKRKDTDQEDLALDSDPIKGKKKNRRFQVDEEAIPEKGAPVVSLGNGKDEKKLEVAKNKQPVPVGADSVLLMSLIKAMNQENQVQPQENQGYVRKTISQKPKDKAVDVSLQLRDNDRVLFKDATAKIGVFTKAKAGRWLSSGDDTGNFSRSNNNSTNRPSLPGIRIGDIPFSTEVAAPSRVQQKDVSVADRKGKKIMVQDDEPPRSKGQDRRQNTFEEQDDTVMEIVELMAKNQYERSLPDKEEDVSKKQPAQEAAPRSKKALMIDLNEEAYDDDEMPLEDNDTPQPVAGSAAAPAPSPSSATYGRREQHIIIEIQQRSRNFVPISRPTLPSSYRSFPPPMQNIRATSSIQYPSNGQWLGNVPVMATPTPYRALQGCHACQPQYREVVQPMWPPSMITPHVHHRPVYYNLDQSTNPNMLPQASNNVNLPADFGTRLLAPEIAINSLFNTPVLGVPSPLGYQNGQASWNPHQQNTAMRNDRFPVYNRPETMVFASASNERLQPHQRHALRNEVPVYNLEDSVVFASPRNQHQTVYNRHGNTTLASSSDNQHQPSPTVNNRHGNTTVASSSRSQERKAETSNSASVLPSSSRSEPPMECIVNRNPADFTVPEPGNVYMLTGDDLKINKRARRSTVSNQNKKKDR